MKKTLFFLLALLLCFSAVCAEQPRGLYRLQRFVYADGSSRMPGFVQYKYAADSVGLLLIGPTASRPGRWGSARIEIREDHPLTPTGDQPQGADGHGVRIFNASAERFDFKWYNESWPGMGHLNEFITEEYSRERVEPQMVQLFSVLEDKFDHTSGRFSGWWTCVETAANPDGSGPRSSCSAFWKVYSPGMSAVIRCGVNPPVLGCNIASDLRFEGDSVLVEGGHRCTVHWISDDCHALTFTPEGGRPTTEIWVRGGLPPLWQTVFGTSVPCYRYAGDCLTDALNAASEVTKGDDPDGAIARVDSFLAEAREKNVPLRYYANVVAAIGSGLIGNSRMWKLGRDFCSRQRQCIDDYIRAGHERDVACDLAFHLLEGYRAVALYRLGEVEEGRRLIKECLEAEERDIKRYRGLTGMEGYINALNYARLYLYSEAYDVIGADLTLIFLDALPVVAPDVLERNGLMALECRGNCLLQRGEKEAARRVWEQIRERQSDYFEQRPENSPLRQAFGR